MPALSNPALPPPPEAVPAPRRMPRLNKTGWIIKSLATLFVAAFLCAWFTAYSRYSTPHAQTSARLTHPFTQTLFTPTRAHIAHRRPAFLRVRHARHRPQHRTLYQLASLRRLRRLFSQLLVVRS